MVLTHRFLSEEVVADLSWTCPLDVVYVKAECFSDALAQGCLLDSKNVHLVFVLVHEGPP